MNSWARNVVLTIGAFCGSAGLAAPAAAAEWKIVPGKIELVGPHARQRLVLERYENGQAVGEATGPVFWRSLNPRTARIEKDVVVPVSDGATEIVAEFDGDEARVPVTVSRSTAKESWSFRNHVQSVFAKSGCNSGACHGALAGKGGFKLSLRGYDVERDYLTITRQAGGRRVELADPARSLLLTKPTGAVPHKGGFRFEVDSPEYRAIVEWLADGAPAPKADEASIVSLEVLPEAARLVPGARQQLLVRARFSDGRVEDVTNWAKYTATNETVAKVDDVGKVTVAGAGEGSVSVWYLSRIVIARITVPFPYQIPAERFEKAPKRNFIDEGTLAKLRTLNLAPAARCSDEVFVRRAFIDTIGLLPTAGEAAAFIADSAPDKRDQLIETLLSRKEFVDYWTYKWSDVLLVNGKRLRPQAVEAYYDWIRKCVAENKPWDQLAREIVSGEGDSLENGATNFFALHQDPLEMTENATMAFLSLNINCARCHNHPLEKWTNNQYYAMANLFARVRAKGWGGDFRSGDGRRTVYEAEEGELIQPITGKPQPPTPLDGVPLAADAKLNRREYLAQWLTSPENPYFRRAIANRVWANFFGVGLVEPVDDLRASNPASNEELLSAAGDYLVQHKFDLKSLMRAILQSETYQRSSEASPENQADSRFYSRYYPRRMMAEAMLDAVCQVTESPSDFTEVLNSDSSRSKTTSYPKGTRAMQLKDSAVASQFLDAFGRNERMITCDCERSDTPSIVQVLHLSNGDTLNRKLAAPDNRLSRLLTGESTDAEILDDAYLSALARRPTEAERKPFLELLGEAKPDERREVLEDLYWGLMSSREFLFNH